MTPERKERLDRVLSRRQQGLAVVMENIEDPHNIFAIARTCDAVGVQDIFVLNTVFEKKRKYGTRSSSSASKWVTLHHFEDMEDCMQEVKKNYGKVLATYLNKDAQSIYDTDFTESAAVVFGNERKGVSDEMLAYCDGTLIIPQMGIIKSLNVSVACAVTLYEALRQRSSAGMYDGKHQLPEKKLEVLREKWYINDKRSE